ncbi:MAG: energy-coupling factor transporter transmembrane protein EcfT [Spirochaetes bacterium]|nr:energy-coupling factor transporter transmembrane protein EcfT [Spirochaetota bacterium]MBU1081513.1 energy-coupling factor transporter transmembrane protein EcfT [Spirochaetota bacterium]
MRDPSRALAAFYSIDALARRHSPVHDRHPVALCATTAAFVVTAASFGRRDVSALLPLFLYPFVTLALSGLRPAELLGRVVAASPAILAIAALSPIFERAPVRVGPWILASGWLSCASIALKLALTVSAAFLLVATAGMGGVARGLRAARLPKLVVLVFQMTYRYVALLLSEVSGMARAHELRAGPRKGVGKTLWGPMLGGLLLRSYDRAGRVHDAMAMRGFDGEYRSGRDGPFGGLDAAYCTAWSAFFAAARFLDISGALGRAAGFIARGAAS